MVGEGKKAKKMQSLSLIKLGLFIIFLLIIFVFLKLSSCINNEKEVINVIYSVKNSRVLSHLKIVRHMVKSTSQISECFVQAK